jgi:hypothetical protein
MKKVKCCICGKLTTNTRDTCHILKAKANQECWDNAIGEGEDYLVLAVCSKCGNKIYKEYLIDEGIEE